MKQNEAKKKRLTKYVHLLLIRITHKYLFVLNRNALSLSHSLNQRVPSDLTSNRIDNVFLLCSIENSINEMGIYQYAIERWWWSQMQLNVQQLIPCNHICAVLNACVCCVLCAYFILWENDLYWICFSRLICSQSVNCGKLKVCVVHI